MRPFSARSYEARAALRGAFALLASAAFAALAHAGEDMTEMNCKADLPTVCYEQGQAECAKSNAHPDKQTACAAWVDGCAECQAGIQYCFERSKEPVLDGSAECTACKEEVAACMAALDKEFWPNR